MKQRQTHYYCDFDGTIAERDMIGVIIRAFVPEQGQGLVNAVNQKRLTVREGVEQMFGMIPSSRYDEMVVFGRQETQVREGFFEWVPMALDAGDPISVVSGGFDFFVEPVTNQLPKEVRVHCNRLDTSGEFLRVIWETECDDVCDGGCGLCKPTVIRTCGTSVQRIVVIGDGVTDLKAARLADFVYARDRLLDACEREGLSHAPFHTFHDIMNREQSVRNGEM